MRPEVVDLARFQAVLFDLDGVLTDTARVHTAAWKETFDDFLRERAIDTGQPFVPFDPDADYKRYVDGMPRYDGVRRFLSSRGIELPEGEPSDPPTALTVHGLGNRKNDLVTALFDRGGIEPYPGSVRLVERLRTAGVATAVVSSSRNCVEALRAAGISHLFDAVVDGVVAAELGLPGKPAPDTFLEAARRLGVPVDRAVVVEDAISGVQAGRAGGFALVVGVDREGQPEQLVAAGADVVVADLGELVH